MVRESGISANIKLSSASRMKHVYKMNWEDATHHGAWKATITWAVLLRVARNVVEFNSTTPSNCGSETM